MKEEIRKFCNRWAYEEDEKTYMIDELILIIKKAKEEERAKLSKTLWNYEQDNNKMRKKLLNSQKRNKELNKVFISPFKTDCKYAR